MVTIIYLLKKVIPLKAQRQEAEAPDGAGSDLAAPRAARARLCPALLGGAAATPSGGLRPAGHFVRPVPVKPTMVDGHVMPCHGGR
jgi:hypothetical protein